MRRPLLPAICLLLLTIALAGCVDAPQPPHAKLPPAKLPSHGHNVLLIVIDDMRPEFGCYGRAHIKSPNIDALAAEGVLFERAYAQMSACAPSRASFFTGCYPNTTNVHWFTKSIREGNPKLTTLPRHFREHGYETYSFGKNFHFGQRDDEQAWSEEPWKNETHLVYLTDDARHKTGVKDGVRGPVTEAADVPDKAYPDGQTALAAIDKLQALKDSKRPFFMSVGFVRPHLPFNCPQMYWDLYPADSIEMPVNLEAPRLAAPNAGHGSYEPRFYSGVPLLEEITFTPDMLRKMTRGYYACTSYVDALVGQVIDELKRLDLYENTTIVLVGDHGFHLGENGVVGKATNYELGLRSPLIVKAAGAASGKHTKGLTELVDVFPTLCELAGIASPQQLEGISLVPLLQNPDRRWANSSFSQIGRIASDKSPITGYSVRTDRYRFVSWNRGSDSEALDGNAIATELYDYHSDQPERANVVDVAEHREAVETMKGLLRSNWTKTRKPPSASSDSETSTSEGQGS